MREKIGSDSYIHGVRASYIIQEREESEVSLLVDFHRVRESCGHRVRDSFILQVWMGARNRGCYC